MFIAENNLRSPNIKKEIINPKTGLFKQKRLIDHCFLVFVVCEELS
jgi:hypothetical protein